MKCAECGTCFKPQTPTQLFCASSCKDVYHNRLGKRGKRLAPLIMASRTLRDSDTAKRAYVESYRLVAEFNAEDKAAGRLSAHALVDHGYRWGTRA